MGQTLQPIDDYGYPTRPNSRRKLRNILVSTTKKLLLCSVYIGASLLGDFATSPAYWPTACTTYTTNLSTHKDFVVRLDLIGDLVLSLPVVRLLRQTYPDSRD